MIPEVTHEASEADWEKQSSAPCLPRMASIDLEGSIMAQGLSVQGML